MRQYWAENGQPGPSYRLMLSFHGVPKRTLELGDPYHCECLKTGRLLSEALGLPKEQVEICFQSRFGKAEWLQPYTDKTIEQLAKDGVRRRGRGKARDDGLAGLHKGRGRWRRGLLGRGGRDRTGRLLFARPHGRFRARDGTRRLHGRTRRDVFEAGARHAAGHAERQEDGS